MFTTCLWLNALFELLLKNNSHGVLCNDIKLRMTLNYSISFFYVQFYLLIKYITKFNRNFFVWNTTELKHDKNYLKQMFISFTRMNDFNSFNTEEGILDKKFLICLNSKVYYILNEKKNMLQNIEILHYSIVKNRWINL